MYLSRLYIENFRSLKELDLKFEKGKNIIVGKNNSGKSNIIKAIDLILGKNSPTWNKSDNITDNDFFEGKTENEIFIWCELKKSEGELLNLSDAKGAFFKLFDKYIPIRMIYLNFLQMKGKQELIVIIIKKNGLVQNLIAYTDSKTNLMI